jgi:hypothetical protein
MSASPRTAEPSLATRSTSVEVWILWVAVAVALAYLVLQRPYAGDVALKTSMCVLLAIVAFRGKLKLFALALLFSAAGDAFLAYDGERLFVPGLASFLATHVLYAVVFVLATKGAATSMSSGRKQTLAAIPTFAAAYSAVLWPNLGGLAIPVMLYIGDRRDGDAVAARPSDRGATRRGAVHGFGQPDLPREVLVASRLGRTAGVPGLSRGTLDRVVTNAGISYATSRHKLH